MSSGPLPPVPDLIPITALAIRAASSGPMGEQRSRRPPPADLIDSCVSRGPSAAPPARKARSTRHHRHRKPAKRHSTSSEEERKCSARGNARVNPIFVWVRQEDTRIVDVKCEDYDKRNRILLTKTAQGWRAIPRTETLAAPRSAHHHHHRHRKSKRGKVRRKSAAVQVDSDFREQCDEDVPWSLPVCDIESHLPSHKIHVPKKAADEQCVEPAANECSAQTRDEGEQEDALDERQEEEEGKCSDNKLCDDVSPLDNLLAVAEFEFNQHMQSGEWDKSASTSILDAINNKEDDLQYQEIDDEQKEFINNMEQLNSLIDSCTKTSNDKNSFSDDAKNTDECDYNEDDDNNLAMDDILSRLEQSLQSPESPETNDIICHDEESKQQAEETMDEKLELETKSDYFQEESDINENIVPDENEHMDELLEPQPEEEEEQKTDQQLVESSSPTEEPTDLSLKQTTSEAEQILVEEPTDLTVPKTDIVAKSPQRPPSENSEAIQSPQPSGIPAIPPSPDIVTSSHNTKHKSLVFLESLLTTPNPSSEAASLKQKEPLDLGKSRKSASPTVTCSEEVQNRELEPPPAKKFKPNRLTLKNLLDLEANHPSKTDNHRPKVEEKRQPSSADTPRLLELLKPDSGPDPLAQLRLVLADARLNVPDPMLVPKERLSCIISQPGTEIPLLLKQRPELRLPEALAFPHLLQDPDILVITLQQLETIIRKQHQQLEVKPSEPKKKPVEAARSKSREAMRNDAHHPTKSVNEMMASDIDAATAAAFNQMIWMPYFDQLQSMSAPPGHDMMKMLSSALPMYPAPEMPRFPPLGFPLQSAQLGYGLEMSMWQEAMLQANLLKPKPPFEPPPHPKFASFAKSAPPAKPAKPAFQPNIPPGFPPNFFPNQSFHHPNKAMAMPPHYNQLFSSQKHAVGHQSKPNHAYKTHQHGSKHHQERNNFSNYYQQKLDELKMKQATKGASGKVAGKTFANAASYQSKERLNEFGRHHLPPPNYVQPIDLSGSTAPPNAKLKVKQHLIDPSKLLKHADDNPEVGSTTASVEEMQDAHKHLWHPLFGNQKGYHNPWNWTTVTATGE